MKRKILTKVLFLFSLCILIQTTTGSGLQTPETPETLMLTFNEFNYQFSTTTLHETRYSTLSLPNEGYTQIPGQAQLPVVHKIIEIPFDTTPILEITSETWTKMTLAEKNLPLHIIPVQPSYLKLPNQKNEFIIDQNYYSQKTVQHTLSASITDIVEIRGRRCISLQINPVQYLPATGELSLLQSISLTIHTPNANIEKTNKLRERYTSKPFENMLSTYCTQTLPKTKNSIQNNDGYLIIVSDTFFEEIQPLATWKQNKGYTVTVTKTSEIPTSPTKENIKNYIKNAYDTWSPPPTYVLLVGDTAQIPPWTGQSSHSATDLYYTTMNPDDYFPDLFIGRFPAATENHVNAMVQKTIYYEQGNFSSYDYITKAAFMASTDNYPVSEGTHNYVISTFLEPHDYLCDKLYTYTYHATTQQVRDALNNGRSLAVYSGHGGTTLWADGPVFTQSDVNSLTNEGMYPFICSHACVTGEFTASECFGETWLRAPNKAGLAFWGASANTLWGEDDILERKMFTAWWNDGLETIGSMTDMAKYYLYQYYGGSGYTRYYFECYNILGDPSVILLHENPDANQAPETPNPPTGPTTGITYTEYTFCVTTPIDPEGSLVYLKFDWGDGTSSPWLGPYESNQQICIPHIWQNQGQYQIKVKAKDIQNKESTWSEPVQLTITFSPGINITTIQGGLKINVHIHNTADMAFTDIPWTITLTDGFILQGKQTTEILQNISIQEETIITSDSILGIGFVDITVTIQGNEKTTKAFIFGPFIFIIHQ